MVQRIVSKAYTLALLHIRYDVKQTERERERKCDRGRSKNIKHKTQNTDYWPHITENKLQIAELNMDKLK